MLAEQGDLVGIVAAEEAAENDGFGGEVVFVQEFVGGTVEPVELPGEVAAVGRFGDEVDFFGAAGATKAGSLADDGGVRRLGAVVLRVLGMGGSRVHWGRISMGMAGRTPTATRLLLLPLGCRRFRIWV